MRGLRLFAYLTRVVIALALAGAMAYADPAPSFWDPALHLEKPDISGVRAIRFLTADDYPPLNFARGDGELSGFNVEIARAICEELHIGCTIQARRFDTLVDALETGKGDALIASLATTPALRDRLDFTTPYYSTPARFVVRKDTPLADVTPAALNGRNVGVVSGSAHEAYLKAFFRERAAHPLSEFHCAAPGARRPFGRRDLCRWADARGMARRRAGGRLLRVQRRPVHRKPVLRRGGFDRDEKGRFRAAPRHGLGAGANLGARDLRRNLSQVFSHRVLLRERAL